MPQLKALCQICNTFESRYTCSSCRATRYCSVACCRSHTETCAKKNPSPRAEVPVSSGSSPAAQVDCCHSAEPPDSLDDPPTLRPLTSLKWPYVPDDSTHDDPLKRDDPKPLTLHQYEAIATSPSIRTLLTANPRLQALLTSIDQLRGAEREEALQRVLGIDGRQIKHGSKWQVRNVDETQMQAHETDEDIKAFRMLAEAIETAVRGGKNDVLGLDWD
ncbi:hypothetical protein PISMIDRAFT_690980, partial [Pisolithus microcarpus 441]